MRRRTSATLRRPRERGQGHREVRVNLRVSAAEHAELASAAVRNGLTVAGYAATRRPGGRAGGTAA
jgi:hypothetical protein